jgi:hypothetical protein
MREYGDVVRLVVGPLDVRFDLHCVFHTDGVKAVLAGSREGYSSAPVLPADGGSIRLDTQGITLRPGGAVPIRPEARKV